MRFVSWHFDDYKFEDNNPNLDCFRRIIKMEEKNELSKMDALVISSMFELHKQLPPLLEALFGNEFLLVENEKIDSGNQKATWKYDKSGETTRVLKYKKEMWDTMWMRSDHYHIDLEYRTGDIVATYEYRNCEDNYGASKEHYKHGIVKKNNLILVEIKEEFPTPPI